MQNGTTTSRSTNTSPTSTASAPAITSSRQAQPPAILRPAGTPSSVMARV